MQKPKKVYRGGQDSSIDDSDLQENQDLEGDEVSEEELSFISNAEDDEHMLDLSDNNELNMNDISLSDITDEESFPSNSAFPSTQENSSVLNLGSNVDSGSLHLSDLNNNNSKSTTREEVSFGGKRGTKKRKTHKKIIKKCKNTKKLIMRYSKKMIKRGTNKKLKLKTKTKSATKSKIKRGGFIGDNGSDMERYGETNPYSFDIDSDPRF